MNWIRSKDRLPDRDGEYLVYCGEFVAHPIYLVASRDDGTWLSPEGDMLELEVTHWMALPNPPSEKVLK